MPISIPKHPPLYSLISFLAAFVTPSSKILEFLRVWTIFIMPFISLFEIIKAAIPEPCIFFWTLASITEAASVILNDAKRIASYITGTGDLLNNDPILSYVLF